MGMGKYTVKHTTGRTQWIAAYRNVKYVYLGARPKSMLAKRLCERSAGRALRWSKVPTGWEGT